MQFADFAISKPSYVKTAAMLQQSYTLRITGSQRRNFKHAETSQTSWHHNIMLSVRVYSVFITSTQAFLSQLTDDLWGHKQVLFYSLCL